MTIGGRPRHYIANRFQDLGEIVRDDTTGLMWQKSWGSSIRYTETQHYIQQLNHQQFAGYADWRLPTIPELLSIVEPEKHESGLYINPIFTPAASYHWCWSADTRLNDDDSELTVWYVIFRFGNVHWDTMKNIGYVLAVRSM
ncbi:MAG: DUF1566 domain-containing protein [bacterium]|nr:DUF1566 domain-containing protein [bacterium]